MTTLYVANCNPRQDYLLMYRLPEQRENTLPREHRIRPMTVLTIPNLTEPEAAAIEEHLTRYGAHEAGERLAGGSKVERLYSRSPIRDERVRQALAFDVGLMEKEGAKRLVDTAAALSVRAEETMADANIAGNLATLEASVQEDSEDPQLALGARVRPSEQDVARRGYARRNRSRKA